MVAVIRNRFRMETDRAFADIEAGVANAAKRHLLTGPRKCRRRWLPVQSTFGSAYKGYFDFGWKFSQNMAGSDCGWRRTQPKLRIHRTLQPCASAAQDAVGY